MRGIRIWNFLMALLTFAVLSPYVFAFDSMLEAAHLTAIDSNGEHQFLIGFAYQGLAMGLYCLWGAVDATKGVEALRFLTLYMVCVVFGRGMAVMDNPEPLGMPMVAFVIDTLVTIIGAVILVRYLRAQQPTEA
jgi:hypothetical protein|tara:strand:+ start:28850 stop:29251 length:402 start_codon:yes stop_codon:yes gene_type:complete